MIQSPQELEEWYQVDDPWQYEESFDDVKRRDILLAELPTVSFKNVLDIGCGHGFITRDLPGDHITGVDISEKAIQHAMREAQGNSRLEYIAANLFSLVSVLQERSFDLIIITGVLYPQYIGRSTTLVYSIIDELLSKNGFLVSVHISDWYSAHFPYPLMKKLTYDYRTYTHVLEVYTS